MKKIISQSIATRVRFVKGCGWSIQKIMDKFKLSRVLVKKICQYEIEEKKDKQCQSTKQ